MIKQAVEVVGGGFAFAFLQEVQYPSSLLEEGVRAPEAGGVLPEDAADAAEGVHYEREELVPGEGADTVVEACEGVRYGLHVGVVLRNLGVALVHGAQLLQVLLRMPPAQPYERAALDGAAQLDYGDDHLPVELAAVVAQYGVERLEVARLGEVRDDGAPPRRHLEEAHAGQVLKAYMYYRLAYLHLLGQLPLAGQAVAGLERAGEDHALYALYKQLLYRRGHYLSEFQTLHPPRTGTGLTAVQPYGERARGKPGRAPSSYRNSSGAAALAISRGKRRASRKKRTPAR